MSSAAVPRVLPEKLAAARRAAERWLVLTGARISADSGLTTFREAQMPLSATADCVLAGTASTWLAAIATTLGEAVS